MFKTASDFWQSKSTWAAALVICTAVAGYLEGHLNGQITVAGVLYAIFKAFERDAVAKQTDAINALFIEDTDGGDETPSAHSKE